MPDPLHELFETAVLEQVAAGPCLEGLPLVSLAPTGCQDDDLVILGDDDPDRVFGHRIRSLAHATRGAQDVITGN